MNSFADFFWYMIEFFFLFMLIWIFIGVFADIFRRSDIKGGMKALWVIVIFIIPFFGALIYLISRPHLAGDMQAVGGPKPVAAAAPAASGASAAEQVSKLTALHDSGALTDAEFEAAKAKALA
jgi:uncharacterized membrane protein YcfT